MIPASERCESVKGKHAIGVSPLWDGPLRQAHPWTCTYDSGDQTERLDQLEG